MAQALEPRSEVVAGRAQAPAVQALTAEDVRRVVREELAAQGGGTVAAASTPTAPPSAAQAAAASTAQSVLQTAIARRSWTEADADEMRATFDQLTPDQQAEILRQYAVAVNQGRLVPQTERMPF
jgi:hypothetical protein